MRTRSHRQPQRSTYPRRGSAGMHQRRAALPRWAALAGLLAIFLLLASGGPRLVAAAGEEVRITPASVIGPPGGSVTVDVEVVAPPTGLGAWTIDVTYPPGVVSTPTCQAFVGSSCNPSVFNAPTTARVNGSAVPALTGTFSVARLTFPIVGTAGASGVLDATVRTFTNQVGTSVPRTVTDGAVTVATQADLSVTLTDSPDPVTATRTLTYTATVSNAGPQPATSVTLTDALPAGFTLATAVASPAGASCTGTATVTCSLGTLASGASATVTITGKPTTAGTLSNTVSVAAAELDPVSGNNSATATTAVNPIPLTEPAWEQLSPAPDPVNGVPNSRGNGDNQALGYDPVSNRLIFFGGTRINGTQHLNDTWILKNADGSSGAPTWERLFPTNPPAGRDLHAGAYDQRNNVLIVYGGCLGGCTPIDTGVYALDYANGLGGTPAWRTVATSGGPPSMRVGTTATYDAALNRLIVFGGDDGFGNRLNVVWVLTNANGLSGPAQWIQLNPSGAPPPGRVSHTAEYDYTNNRLIIFGGGISGGQVNDTWVLTNANGLGGAPQWIQLSPTGTPPAVRSGHLSLYDQATNRMMIFGGVTGSGPFTMLNDMWVLSCANGLGCTPAWQALDPFGTTIPPGRSGPLAAHNSVSNRLVLWSGSTVTTLLSDTWVLKNANGIFGSPSSSLMVTASVSPAPVTVGNPVTQTLTVVNGGANSATGVKLVDLLPDYMDLIGFADGTVVTSQGTCDKVTEIFTVSCDLGTMTAGGTATITITVRQNKGGLHNSTIYLSANETDLVPADNSVAATENGVGDVNDDGQVDAVDSLCIKLDLAGLTPTGACPRPLPYPDVNLVGGATILDALCVDRSVAGIQRNVPCPIDPVILPPVGAPGAGAARAAAVAAPAGGRPGAAAVTVRVEGPETIAPGAEADLRVVAGGAVRPGAWTVELELDPRVLSVVRCTSTVSVCNADAGPGVVRLSGSSPDGLADGAVLATVTVRATGAAGSSSFLRPRVLTLAGTRGERLSGTAAEARLTVAGGARSASPTPTPTPSQTAGRGQQPTSTPTPTPPPPSGRGAVQATPTPTPAPPACGRSRC